MNSTGYSEDSLGRLYTWNEAYPSAAEQICPGMTGGNSNPSVIRSTNADYWMVVGTNDYGLNIHGAWYMFATDYADLKVNANLWTSDVDNETQDKSWYFQLNSSNVMQLSASQVSC